MAGQSAYAGWHMTAPCGSARKPGKSGLDLMNSLASADALSTDLRSLFRDSEARAARLRLLIQVSRELETADGERLDAALATASQKAALFTGYAHGAPRHDSDPLPPDARLFPFERLADHGDSGRGLMLWGPRNPASPGSEEDEEALRLLVEMIESRLIMAHQQSHQARLLDRLAQRERELEQVLSEVVRAQETERRALSADLHDGVAQQITALHRRLELLQLDLPAGVSPSLSQDVGLLIDVARRSVGDLRRMIAGLRPTSLDDLGVVAALREEARRLEALGHQVHVRERGMRRLPDWQETLIFRVAQEGLNNAAKHAPGSTVELEIILDAAAGEVVLTVADDGGRRPAEPRDASERLGLEIMRERLMAVACKLEAGPVGGGFQIRATMPLAGA